MIRDVYPGDRISDPDFFHPDSGVKKHWNPDPQTTAIYFITSKNSDN
jgi:hypothetical protein